MSQAPHSLASLADWCGIPEPEPVVPVRPQRYDPRKAKLAKVRALIRKRRMEGIQLIKTLPHLVDFHKCLTRWAIIWGSNRSSKTETCAIEFCRAVLGCDPYDKYPRKGGNALVVAKDLDDVARIWRTCSEPGAFEVVKSVHGWRAVRPDPNDPSRIDPDDEARRDKWQPGPPLIPERMIKHIAWENPRKKIPRYVEFTTGWRVLFRSSISIAPQGDKYNLVWLDEQMQNPLFYQEANRGLVGFGGKYSPKGIWSATSQTTNLQLYKLYQASKGESSYITPFKATVDQNCYIPPDEKLIFYDSMESDAERRIRYYGEFALIAQSIYKHYDPMGVHGCDPFLIKPNWCRVVVLDPSWRHCASLFFAIDPDDAHVYVYDGFDLPNGDARGWAEEIKSRQGDMKFYGFVIDQQMGKQHETGPGETVAAQYFAALKEIGIEPQVFGPLSGFFPGSRDIEGRTKSLLGWMSLRGTGTLSGTSRLQVMRGVVPKLDDQIHLAHTRTDRPDKRATGKLVEEDLLQTLEYGAAFDPHYYPPEPVEAGSAGERSVADLLEEKRERRRNRIRSRAALAYY